jgi:DNA-binding response OmpR family regulator
MTAPTVLIISTEPIIGALLAVYVELHHYRATLAEEQQSPDEAAAECGASLILVDIDHPDAFSLAFVERQRAAGRRVVAFSPKMFADEVNERAARLNIPAFALPIDVADFGAVLAAADSTAPPPTARTQSSSPERRA